MLICYIQRRLWKNLIRNSGFTNPPSFTVATIWLMCLFRSVSNFLATAENSDCYNFENMPDIIIHITKNTVDFILGITYYILHSTSVTKIYSPKNKATMIMD
jgi:hypothetical protein